MRDWKYDTRTEGAIRSALLELLTEQPLANVTVAELCRYAHVSRSTFYEHFDNIANVYDAIVEEFSAGLSPVIAQVACPGENACTGEPFCARLRESSPFAPAVGDDRFLGALLRKSSRLEKHDLYNLLTDAGYASDQARAVCAFQLAGCFTAVRMAKSDKSDWQKIKPVIDRFILGGIAACLAYTRDASDSGTGQGGTGQG